MQTGNPSTQGEAPGLSWHLEVVWLGVVHHLCGNDEGITQV